MGGCGPASVGGGGGVRVPLRRDGRFANRPYGGAFGGVAIYGSEGRQGASFGGGGRLDVLVEEDGVAVWVFCYEAVGAVGGLVGFTDEGDAFAF